MTSAAPVLPARPSLEADILRARAVVAATGRASTSALQRRLRIGYCYAVALLEALERRGVVGPIRPEGGRDVLIAVNEEVRL